jgi:hypothetical protein
VTQDEYLRELRTGKIMKFEGLIALIDDDYDYTLAGFTNGEVANSPDENQGSAKLFCFAAIHQLSQLETLHCFGQYYQDVLNTPHSDSHANIRNFITYGWEGLKFDSPVLSRK